MIAIAVSTAALVIILSAMNGLTGTVAGLYNALEPDLKISPGYSRDFEYTAELKRRLGALDGIRFVSQTLSDKALLKKGEAQVLVTVKGVDANFTRITKLDSVLAEGFNGLADSSRNYMLSGWGVAEQLGVNQEEFSRDVQMFSPKKGKHNSIDPADELNEVYGTVCGQFTLNNELDFQTVYVNLNTARELFGTPSHIGALEIACEPGKTKTIQAALQGIFGDRFVIKNRYQLNDLLFKTLETEKLATFIILAFILVIATFNLIGALTMLIIEKRKDIKTLYSLGADLGMIRGIFMREGLFISALGAVIGLFLGLTVCLVQIKFHLVKFGNDFIIPYYPVELQVQDFLKIFALILVIAFLAALYPVRVFTRADLVHARS
ncbi:MAG TPA: FtsX-like permease family protein [Bacteroidia bacterium]|nr:FtsX-like permease family protein [Bacteroidia bacterium]